MLEELLYEKSCGAVVYCQVDNDIKYLLACEHGGFWVFPKGHMEDGESEQETALREVKEESEISKIVLLDFESVMATLQFDSFKHILTQAHSFLGQKYH